MAAVPLGLQLALACLIVLLSLGLGATLDMAALRLTLRQPRALIIGAFSQFLLMPFIAFCVVKMFDFNSLVALGVILVGSSPGGSTSNIFTYWTKGDVSLSIVMTVTSSTLAFGLLIANTALYSEALGINNDIDIPYLNIALAMLLVLVPVLSGMFIKHKSDKWAVRVEKVGSAAGLLFIAAAMIYGVVANTDLLGSSYKLYLSAILLEFFGLMFGYSAAWIAGLPQFQRRTVAFETGVQNSSLTIAIVLLSFPEGKEQDEVLLFPLFYSFFLIVTCAVQVILFRFVIIPKFDPDALTMDPKERVLVFLGVDPTSNDWSDDDDSSLESGVSPALSQASSSGDDATPKDHTVDQGSSSSSSIAPIADSALSSSAGNSSSSAE